MSMRTRDWSTISAQEIDLSYISYQRTRNWSIVHNLSIVWVYESIGESLEKCSHTDESLQMSPKIDKFLETDLQGGEDS